MCGICGVVGRELDSELVKSMTALMAHRGPDGEGIQLFPHRDGLAPAALGHRRLSIIDPTPRGSQPMSYGEGERLWITYNGELYNFRELRSGLKAEGFRFKSNTDTEVLLALYLRYGPAMLQRLNGIYSFGIWDAERHELFLARDRLGVKPLYYAEYGEALYFASEAKALLHALPPARLRHDALAEYLTFLWVPDPDTLFEGIYKLPPGHFATYARGELKTHKYWDMTFAPERRTQTEWSSSVRQAVHAAVNRQMVSDVPLGGFLSGGIDSSAIIASMNSPVDKITTYTVGWSREDLEYEIVPDDLRYAREIGEELDVDYNEQILSPDVVDLLPRLVWHMDEPVADPAAITTYLICAAAHERLTVILSGMGGDEIFAGYPRYLAARIARSADVMPRWARHAMRRGVGKMRIGGPGRLRGPRRNLLKLARGIDMSSVERYLVYSSYYKRSELAEILSDELRTEVAERDPLDRHRQYFADVADEHWLNQLLYVDMKTFLPCLNLTYTDKMSMAASTEVRVPLLDDELVSLSGRIPPELKLHRTTRKYIFKRSMRDVLPDKVINRPKAGFGAPVRSWLIGDLKPMVADLLSPDVIAERGLFNPRGVQKLIKDNETGIADNALQIWALLTLELWLRTFIDGSGAKPSHSTPHGNGASASGFTSSDV